MDFVKREENIMLDEENYKMYLENLQKSHQIDTTDYQHTAISMEQLHQVVQSSFNNSSFVHNLQLPISPRQMSTLMLKTNHRTRSLNFNDLPSHLSKNLPMDMELLPLANEMQQLRHEDMLNQLELQNSLAHLQNLHEQEMTRNIELSHSLSRVNELSQNIGREMSQELMNEIDLSQLNRHNIEQTVILSQEDARRSPLVQTIVDNHLLEQHIAQRLEQNMGLRLDPTERLDQTLSQRLDQTLSQRLDQTLSQRLDQTLSQRLDQTFSQRLDQTLSQRLDQTLSQRLDQTLSQRLDQTLSQRLDQTLSQRLDQTLSQRLDQTLCQRLEPSLSQRLDPTSVQRVDQRLINAGVTHDQRILEQSEHLFPMPFHIKAEQEDDGYFYDNINQGINTNNMNSEVSQTHSQPSSNMHQEQMYSVFNNTSVPALNTIDIYSRPQNYIQNYPEVRDNPQNLVVHRQFDNNSPYGEELKKTRLEEPKRDTKIEHPKENLKPADQNKMYYDYNNYVVTEKNEINTSLHNKMNEELSINIKGEYACYKCNEVFPSKRLLKQHAKSCESGENSDLDKLGKFCCSQCAYRCQSPAILKIHERTHTGEKPYACTFCDYKSGQKNNVAKHILVHMKQKPFGCQYCDYKCAQKNNLVVHERTHTGYKPFACPYCDYRTVQKPNLVKHMYLHTDQKPFSCDMCSYRCVQKTNLTKHKQRHTNDCDKMDIKTEVKPYRPRQKSVKCPHCSYRCVQKSSLEKHMQFKHSELQSDFISEGLNLKNDCETIQNLSKKDLCQDVCT